MMMQLELLQTTFFFYFSLMDVLSFTAAAAARGWIALNCAGC